ncbi:hypothetical protein [Streptomyces sp. NPDC058255]|uniref:hypothetical protein n=1 Tax=Streptomyces sp. NPDC058255 TaxID=3346407 RepID=UPI0036E06F2A
MEDLEETAPSLRRSRRSSHAPHVIAAEKATENSPMGHSLTLMCNGLGGVPVGLLLHCRRPAGSPGAGLPDVTSHPHGALPTAPARPGSGRKLQPR